MDTPRILYLSCHEVLEYDELRMFRDLGWSFFAIGSYLSPDKPQGISRPPLQGCTLVPKVWPEYHAMCHRNVKNGEKVDWHGRLLTKSFLDLFDVIIVMHVPQWITRNWALLRGRKVIWRTIGQSTPAVERELAQCKAEGLKIVRYSPMESTIPSFIGEDALIRFGKYKEDFKPWVGSTGQVINICQSIQQRGDFCNYETFRKVIQGLPAKLYGNGNENAEMDIRGGVIGTYDELLDILSRNSVYFYTGTKPASYTLNFMEAAMAGLPMVSIGEKLAEYEGHDYFEVPRIMELFRCGLFSDSVERLRDQISMLLKDRELAEDFSGQIRRTAINLFDAEKIKQQWREFVTSL